MEKASSDVKQRVLFSLGMAKTLLEEVLVPAEGIRGATIHIDRDGYVSVDFIAEDNWRYSAYKFGDEDTAHYTERNVTKASIPSVSPYEIGIDENTFTDSDAVKEDLPF